MTRNKEKQLGISAADGYLLHYRVHHNEALRFQCSTIVVPNSISEIESPFPHIFICGLVNNNNNKLKVRKDKVSLPT